MILCNSPASEPSRVSLQVSPNDIEFSVGGGEFQYFLAPSVHYLVPSRSLSPRSMQVTIVGSHFSKRMQIQFGDQRPIDAHFVSASILYCTLPSRSEMRCPDVASCATFQGYLLAGWGHLDFSCLICGWLDVSSPRARQQKILCMANSH